MILYPSRGCFKVVLSSASKAIYSFPLLFFYYLFSFIPLLFIFLVFLTWRMSWLCKKKDEMWFNYSTSLITHLGTVTINCPVQFISLHWILDFFFFLSRSSQHIGYMYFFFFHLIRPLIPDSSPSTQVMFCSYYWK